MGKVGIGKIEEDEVGVGMEWFVFVYRELSQGVDFEIENLDREKLDS